MSPQTVKSQEDFELSFQRVSEITSIDESLDRLELSPTGNKLAVINHEALCIYSIETDTSHCDTLPWGNTYTNEVHNLGQTYLEWAYNEQFIAFSKYPFCCFSWDSDIWLYNVDSRDFRNLTDDGIQDYFISFGASVDENEILNIPIDFLPLWDESSQFIYFFRAYPAETDIIFDELGVYRVSVIDYSVELVYDLTEVFKPPIYAASISPDGTKIAIMVGGSAINDGLTGIWLLDVSQGMIEYLLPPDTFQAALAEKVDEAGFTFFSDVSWQNNNQFYIVVHGFDLDTNSTVVNFQDWYFNFELERQTVEPLNLLTSDLVVGTTTLFIDPQIEAYFFVDIEPDSDLQRLYYGHDDGFQLVEELPHFSSQYSRIIQIAENDTILSGGLLITLPANP